MYMRDARHLPHLLLLGLLAASASCEDVGENCDCGEGTWWPSWPVPPETTPCKEPNCAEYRTPKTQGQPPAPPTDGSGVLAEDIVFVIRKIRLGDTMPDGTAHPEAWKEYGFDLDGFTASPPFPMHCKPQEGGKRKGIAVDGKGGIDNSFGKNVIGLALGGLLKNPTDAASSSIEAGSGTVSLRIQKSDTSGLVAKLGPVLARKDSQGNPIAPGLRWDTGDYAWSPLLAQETSLEGYLAGDVLVLRGDTVPLAFPGKEPQAAATKEPQAAATVVVERFLPLRLRGMTLSVTLNAERTKGISGQIGGVIETEAYIEDLKKIAGTLSSSFCDGGSAFDGIAQQLRQASDIMADGSQDPMKTCNAISFGLGFEMVAARLGEPALPPAAQDPCKMQ